MRRPIQKKKSVFSWEEFLRAICRNGTNNRPDTDPFVFHPPNLFIESPYRYGELRDIKQTRYITGIPRYYLNYVMINDPTRNDDFRFIPPVLHTFASFITPDASCYCDPYHDRWTSLLTRYKNTKEILWAIYINEKADIYIYIRIYFQMSNSKICLIADILQNMQNICETKNNLATFYVTIIIILRSRSENLEIRYYGDDVRYITYRFYVFVKWNWFVKLIVSRYVTSWKKNSINLITLILTRNQKEFRSCEIAL